MTKAPLHRFPTRRLGTALALTLALVLGGTWTLYDLYGNLVRIVDKELRLGSLSGTITHLDEVLTMSARMAAATGDPRWEARYREIEPLLDAAIKESIALAPDEQTNQSTSETDAANSELVRMERRAFAAVTDGRLALARSILFSEEYERQKSIYAAGMARTRVAFEARATTEFGNQRRHVTAVAAVGVLLLVVIGLIWFQISLLIRRYLAAAAAAEREVDEANRTLERRIEERTAALALANATLTESMEARARVEVELRHAQKLEAVGRLASGIAHEINTPMQFVSDNVQFVKSALLTLTGAAEADVDVTLADLLPALDDSVEGLDRIASLVKSMQEFAHPEQPDKTAVDVNHALKNTIAIARGEYKHIAEVETQLDGDLPKIVGHVNALNQVFLNLIVNAAHAIADDEATRGGRGVIRIATRAAEGHVVVSIADNGGGIPDAIRDKIFDPFFTTKDVGRGTGQGLAIARNIVVEKHGGALTFESHLGRGTTFFVALPLVQSA